MPWKPWPYAMEVSAVCCRLVATYDPRDGTLGSVCRVMSGFSDVFYKENTVRYMGAEFGGEEGEGLNMDRADGGEADGEVGEEGEEGDADADADADSDDDDDGNADADADNAAVAASGALRLACAAEGVATGERPPFWFRPCEVRHLARVEQQKGGRCR